MKLNVGDTCTFDVDTFDAAARPEHDALRIGHPVHVRVNAVHGPDFLQIKVKMFVYRSFRTTNEILYEERALTLDAAHEREILAVR